MDTFSHSQAFLGRRCVFQDGQGLKASTTADGQPVGKGLNSVENDLPIAFMYNRTSLK